MKAHHAYRAFSRPKTIVDALVSYVVTQRERRDRTEVNLVLPLARHHLLLLARWLL
jgi:hypothetical protein